MADADPLPPGHAIRRQGSTAISGPGVGGAQRRASESSMESIGSDAGGPLPTGAYRSLYKRGSNVSFITPVRERTSYQESEDSHSRGSAQSSQYGRSRGLTMKFRLNRNKQPTSRQESQLNLYKQANDEDNPGSMGAAAALVRAQEEAPTGGAKHFRQYNMGDDVLICNVDTNIGRVRAYLVNIHGYPHGKGTTHEEQRGPHMYVLARVKKEHFDENAKYYTVQREDTKEMMRADAEFMEPIKSPQALHAAKEAASMYSCNPDKDDRRIRGCRGCCDRFIASFTLCLDSIFSMVASCLDSVRQFTRRNLLLCLDGKPPYDVKIRLSGIDFLILCHVWFLFIDQIRIALVPQEADKAVTVISLIIWIILVLELLAEIYIWPTGYMDMLRSSEAYSPTTQRYINYFHVVVETVALIAFVPEIWCIFTGESCSKATQYSLLWAIRKFTYGPSIGNILQGAIFTGFTRLRSLGTIRHLTNFFLRKEMEKQDRVSDSEAKGSREAQVKDQLMGSTGDDISNRASHIGTAMMKLNVTKIALILFFIIIFLPFVTHFYAPDTLPYSSVELLQWNNVAANQIAGKEGCNYANDASESWLATYGIDEYNGGGFIKQVTNSEVFVVSANMDVNLTECGDLDITSMCGKEESMNSILSKFCKKWEEDFNGNSVVRKGEQLCVNSSSYEGATFKSSACFNVQPVIALSAFRLFLQQIFLQLVAMGGIIILRRDAKRLVLQPIQQMLKIVSRYKNNPLEVYEASLSKKKKKSTRSRSAHANSVADGLLSKNGEPDALGNYETEQLINAFTRITDLLRKCWGVAGANIITSNLSGTTGHIINPLVPGKCVHALFAFAAIKKFDHCLQNLGQDIMVLINDIAKVLHGEVNRWGFGDSGQCNKNLGAMFLIVFSIGEDREVQDRLEKAQNVVFSHDRSNRRPSTATVAAIESKHPDDNKVVKSDLPLASLPGIANFADRALIGMLKTYAGIHRDREILRWTEDMRLGYGVGVFCVDMIFGMDAGWAVEGAVGSSYKIDATYLSPHVNMASRMMSACKQYGVTILVSEAVESILSNEAKSKLRHLDTITVKGSIKVQRIYTYDVRHKGVNFFLFEQSDELLNATAEKKKTADLWTEDQDLLGMRQHISEEFVALFNRGRDEYIAGSWKDAICTLKKANHTMIRHVIDGGYLEYDIANALSDDSALEKALENDDDSDDDEEIARLKKEMGDGACNTLISYMEKRKGVPPERWDGWRPLMSK